MMNIMISATLQAVGGTIGTETVKALIPLLKKYGKKAKEWLEQNTNLIEKGQNEVEIPADIQEEIQQIAQQYFESHKCPVYMDGVVFFFYEELDDATKQTLREFIRETEWDSDECSEEECAVYNFTNEYLGGEREEMEDFGFEHNTLYLNFAQQSSDQLYNESVLREFAKSLNDLLSDNEIDNGIESFMTFC